jgi:XTP/dITP diphosphohydrolase
MKLALATRNAGKVAEMRALLVGLPIEVRSAAEFGGLADVEEDEATLEGNAVKKARDVYRRTGWPSVADDTGLEVTALGGQPGVFSARYAGPSADPVANRGKLLRALEGVADRSAQFRTVLAYCDRETVRLFEGTCPGAILDVERGSGGFGYDPLFLPEGERQTFAELPIERKNAISHRGRAMRAFLAFLNSHMGE